MYVQDSVFGHLDQRLDHSVYKRSIKTKSLFANFGLVAFIEQIENNVVIVIVFFLLDKGHEAENLQKECLFLLHYHFPMEDSSESYKTSKLK